jgi:hypothetical protein
MGTFALQQQFVEGGQLSGLGLFGVFAVDVDDHLHVGYVFLHLLGEEGDLYLEQVVAEFSKFSQDNRAATVSVWRYVYLPERVNSSISSLEGR